MSWKRTALAALLTVIAVPIAFLLCKAVLTRWYLITEPHGDGQVALSIIGGSAIVSLLCGLVTLGTALVISGRSE